MRVAQRKLAATWGPVRRRLGPRLRSLVAPHSNLAPTSQVATKEFLEAPTLFFNKRNGKFLLLLIKYKNFIMNIFIYMNKYYNFIYSLILGQVHKMCVYRMDFFECKYFIIIFRYSVGKLNIGAFNRKHFGVDGYHRLFNAQFIRPEHLLLSAKT